MIPKAMIISLCLLAVAAGGVVILERGGEASGGGVMHARRIPLRFGEWRGVEHLSDDKVSEILGTPDNLMRTYTNEEGREVIFAAVFAENNRRAAHPPEQCYRGQGMELVYKTYRTYPMPLPAGGYVSGDVVITDLSVGETMDFRVRELIVAKGSQRKVVHYWFKTGKRCTSSFVRHEINMFSNALFGSAPVSNALLRVSSYAESDSEKDIEAARRAVQAFAQAVFPYTISALP